MPWIKNKCFATDISIGEKYNFNDSMYVWLWSVIELSIQSHLDMLISVIIEKRFQLREKSPYECCPKPANAYECNRHSEAFAFAM